MCLDTVLCLKYRRRVGRDNTVKYRWRTLQLLPDRGRPSYAGSVVDVLEGLDGRLAVQHEGRIVASQEAPPRPGILRSFDTRTVHTTVPSRHTNGVIRRSEDEVASMGTMLEVDKLRDDADRNGAARVRKTVTPRSRKPTPLQTFRSPILLVMPSATSARPRRSSAEWSRPSTTSCWTFPTATHASSKRTPRRRPRRSATVTSRRSRSWAGCPGASCTTTRRDGRLGAEGEAQGAVHSWDRPGTGHTQRNREEVHAR